MKELPRYVQIGTGLTRRAIRIMRTVLLISIAHFSVHIPLSDFVLAPIGVI